jgi:hypothetical protein
VSSKTPPNRADSVSEVKASGRSTADDRSTRPAGLLPALAGGAVLAIVLTALALDLRLLALAGDAQGQGSVVVFAAPGLAFGLVGALLIWRRPEHKVGWLFGLVGVLLTTGSLLDHYARYVFEIRHEPLPGGVFAAWYSEWWWIPFLFTVLVFLPLLFPTGHLLSRKWRPIFVIALVTMTVGVVAAALDPELEWSNAEMSVDNPIGISPFGDPDESTLGVFIFLVLFLCIFGSAASLVVRFRRSRGIERQQLKLFTYASALFVSVFVLNGLLDLIFEIRLSEPMEATIALPAVGAGAAILRYRLYDIDLVINRTLVYGLLTAVLAAVYVGAVAGIGSVARALTGQESNSLVIVVSTLAVAALFRPLRARLQTFIDRRFYRQRYDAAATLDGFSARLRDQVDLESLRNEVVSVAGTTMQPTHASLWLRPREEAR